MNQATHNRSKQIGDIIRINAGKYAQQVGVLIEKGHGWIVELESGEKVKIAPRMADNTAPQPAVELSAPTAVQNPELESTVPENAVSSEPIENVRNAQPATAISEIGNTSELAATESTAETEDEFEETVRPSDRLTSVELAVPPELANLNVRQLWDLAKQRGISIARTKADFLRIIRQKHPDENLALLKGKALYDRVSELHISRLRSKRDLLVIFTELTAA